MPMFRSLLLSSLMLGLFHVDGVRADPDLNQRFIAASQKMGEGMIELVKSCAPSIDLSGVDAEFTPRMREATECVVDTHIERFGRGQTEELVEQAEAMAAQSFSSLQEMTTLQQDYPRLSSPDLLEINRSCGTLEASNDLPMNRVLRENMAQMTDCFSGQ